MRLRLPTLPLLFAAAAISCQSTSESGREALTVHPEVTPLAAPAQPAPVVTAAPVALFAQDDGLQDDAARFERLRQQRASLAQQYIDNGNAALDRADLDAALIAFSNAVDVDPGNADARGRLRQVESLMGDRFAVAADAFSDETERAMIRRAQALLAAQHASDTGDQALRSADYGGALEAYREAEIILGFHPYIANDELDVQVIRGKIEETSRMRDEAAVLAERMASDAAVAAQMAAEAAERERRDSKLQEYYSLANEDFLAERYSEAAAWCGLILVQDHGNEAARSLRDIARESQHNKTQSETRRKYREEWLKTFEELDTMNVPQTDALKFYDMDRWRKVSQRVPIAERGAAPAGSSERQAVMAILESTRLAPNFGGPDGEGSPLEEVAAYLQRVTGINFFISTKVREDLDEEETSQTLQLNERSVRKVLDIIADTSENLRWKIEDGVVKFVTVEEMIGGQILLNYSVQDIIHPIPDYPGSEINISPSGGITPPDEDITEREANVVTGSLLEDLIRNNVSPESWDADPANSIRVTETGTLVVNQVPEVHAQIQQLLEDLREATGIMVDIQARFMKVEDNFLEDIGVDFRGLGQPGLGQNGSAFNDFGGPTATGDVAGQIGQGTDLGAWYDEGGDGDLRARTEALYDTSLGGDVLQGSGGLTFQWTFLNDLQLELILRAVSKSERVELVTAPRILVHNTARANLSVLNQVAYVQDFDVEIAQAASIADPIVAVIQDGVILDVRPVVSADRRFITLELRPTIAELQRPIAEKVTTLGSQNSVTIQLPQVEIQRVRTSIPMPDGGTVLLGGMKVSEKQDQRSGVPILNKIPILSALFERKGNFVSNRKLLILLRANIVIPHELEPTPAQLGIND